MGTPSIRLFAQSVRWGVATGTVAGAATGAAIGFKAAIGRRIVEMLLGGPLVVGCYGAFFGAVLSVIPTLIGSVIVTNSLRRRHPHEVTAGAAQRGLGLICVVLVGALNAVFFLVVFAGWDGLRAVGRVFPYVVVANGCVAVMLAKATSSIVSLWAEP